MSKLRTAGLLAVIIVLISCSGLCAVTKRSSNPINNPYGAHLFITDVMSPDNIEKHTTWARSLVGKNGYCKLFLYPITEINASETLGRLPSWKQAVQACYDKEMIPIVRLGGAAKDGVWQKPGDFKKTAEAIKWVVNQLPKSNKYPLIVEVFNEPNLHIEWSGKTEPVEYAQFFIEASKAIRSLKDPRIKIANGALSPGGDFNNVKFISEVCTKVPEFVNSFDIWASHCYPSYPPEQNMHNKTMPAGSYTLDLYMDELKELAKFGRKNVKVIITETAYGLGTDGEDARADRSMRAFRDCWSKWPEVLAVTPYQFSDPWGHNKDCDWVYADSNTTKGGLPENAREQYWEVYKLAKPTDTTSAISGKIKENDFGSPLAGAEVVLNPGNLKTTANTAGNYFFPKLKPGSYSVSVSKENYGKAGPVKLTVAAGKNGVTDFSLKTTSTVTLRGIVTDSLSGLPVQGLTVTTNPGNFKSLTDAKGQYVFVGIPPSTYKLDSAKPDYYAFSVSDINLKPNEAKQVNWATAPASFSMTKTFLPDGEMESAEGKNVADAWTTFDGNPHPDIYTLDKSIKYSGQSSQKITPNGSECNYIWSISNYNDPKTGKRYRIRVWCKTEGADGEIKVIGKFMSNAMELSGEFEARPVLKGDNGWTLLSGSAIAPEFGHLKEKSGRLQVILQANLKKGSAWFDTAWVGEDTGTELPPPIMNLKAESRKFSAQLSWKMPENAKGIKIVYKAGAYPTSVSDGTLIEVPAGAASVTQENLHPSARWYFAAYTVDADGALSEPAFASAQTTLD